MQQPTSHKNKQPNTPPPKSNHSNRPGRTSRDRMDKLRHGNSVSKMAIDPEGSLCAHRFDEIQPSLDQCAHPQIVGHLLGPVATSLSHTPQPTWHQTARSRHNTECRDPRPGATRRTPELSATLEEILLQPCSRQYPAKNRTSEKEMATTCDNNSDKSCRPTYGGNSGDAGPGGGPADPRYARLDASVVELQRPTEHLNQYGDSGVVPSRHEDNAAGPLRVGSV